MLDFVLLLTLALLTAATIAYGDACERLLRNDSTRDTGGDGN